MKPLSIIAFTLFSLNVFGANRALEIALTAHPRSTEQLERVSYAVQGIIGRLVSELAVGGFTLLQPTDGNSGYKYCVQLTSVANGDRDLEKLAANFEALEVRRELPVKYSVTQVESCPAAK